MEEPFDSRELMALLRGLEQREIPFQIEHRRTTADCDGIIVRIQTICRIWEVGFYDNGHIEVLKYDSGNVQPGVTTASLLAEWDAPT
jgi:hypothetical protein